MLVHRFLEHSAQKYPENLAAWYKSRWATYSEIEMKANQTANFLIDSGIQRGDRVALLFENSFLYIISYYGILKSGAVTVALNTELLADDLLYLLNHSEAKAVIIQKKYLPLLNKVLDKTPSLSVVLCEERPEPGKKKGIIFSEFDEVFKSFPEVQPQRRIIDLDLASIIYTSGSTGKPKGVTLSHLNIVSNTRSIVQYLELTSRDRIAAILPFFYVYGKSWLNTHFSVGGSIVIENRFTFPNAVLDTMKNFECTGFAGVPSTFSILMNKSSLQKYAFPHLRYLTQAGGPMAPALQKEVAKIFHPAKLFIMYGATEASARLSYLDPRELPGRWGSIGKAIPNVELYVADQEGNPVPAGETGEIVARGSNIMRGYWKDEEETSRVLRNGLYFTGDLGKMDEDGFLYVVGRSKDMIKSGANRISAKEIEEKILENREIHEVAVIGVPDEILGEAIKAFVVPKQNGQARVEDILTFCKQVLPPYKVPKFIDLVDSLPKSAAGKILKTKLKD